MSTQPDITRLQPTPDSLNVILKNTHFRDGILDAVNKVQLSVDYALELPLLVFKFSEPYYDFLEILKFENFAGINQEWLEKEQILIKLISSDVSIADKLTTREFLLSIDASVHLRNHMHIQKQLSQTQIREREDDIYLNYNEFLK